MRMIICEITVPCVCHHSRGNKGSCVQKILAISFETTQAVSIKHQEREHRRYRTKNQSGAEYYTRGKKGGEDNLQAVVFLSYIDEQ
jgi:hypothetical protein